MADKRDPTSHWALVGLCLLLIWPGSLLAQSTTSSLTGEVRTAEGLPVAGAVVQARAEATGTSRTAISREDGRYRLNSLPPGSWTVVARLEDGRVSQSRSVRLRLQQTVQPDFTVGAGLTEQVTVTAERPLIDRRETAGTLRVDAGQVETLPMAGRVFTDLALLDSSVRPAAPGNFFGERGSVFVVNGQSGRSNSFLVDGLDNNDQTSGTTLNSFYSQQVIQEFVLLTHQYLPEFGRASGGVLNIVTRRGSNEPTWEAFAQGSSSDWNDSGAFVDSLPATWTAEDAVNRYQTGFTLGGPFKKDRAFYFLAYEHQENDDLVPYTGYERGEVGNLDVSGGGRYLAPSRDDNFFFRTDFNLGLNKTLMLRLSADDRETGGVNVGGVNTPESGFRIEERDFALAATLTSVISPGLINEVRFLAAHSAFDQLANSGRPGVARPSGIFGGNNLFQQNRTEARFQLVENVTWHKADHTVKFGLDISRSRTAIAARFNPLGNFIYNYDFAFEPGDCGDLAGWMVRDADDVTAIPCPGVVGSDDDGDGDVDETGNILSYPLIYTYIFGDPDATLSDTKYGLFIQDHWNVGPRFLIDYGLRWDLSTYTLPRSSGVTSVIPNGGADRDTDNFAPRLGFSFTPRPEGKLLFRGGGGLFYDKLVLGFPAVASITSGTEIWLAFPQGFTWEFNEDTVERDGIDAVRATLEDLRPFLEPLIMRFSTGTRLDTPYTVQFNIGMDKGIGQHGALRANIVRSRGYHLPLMRDLNPISGLIPVGVSCNAENIDPEIAPYEGLPCHLGDTTTGSIAAIVSEGRSWYTGVDLSWRWQRESSWFSSSYTWSRAEDMGFDPLKGGISLPPDASDRSGERGRADGDRRHRFVMSGDSALPWMGMRASGVLQISSGIPFNVTTGIDGNVDGILSDRPEGVPRNSGENSSLGAINAERAIFNEEINFNPEWLLDPVTSLREPSFIQVDLRLYKPFLFADGRGKGQFFFQIFNLLNRENVGLIEGRVTSRNFGQPITLAGPPRTIEIGFRVGY